MVRIIPITLREANEFIVRRHRHLGKAAGCKFALGLTDENGELIGVAVCGRPVSRYYDNGETIEICRVCTDGTYNACSMLYGACVRVGRLWGIDGLLHILLKASTAAALRRLILNMTKLRAVLYGAGKEKMTRCPPK